MISNMPSLAFAVLIFIASIATVRAVLLGRGLFEFPVAISMLTLAWVIPQGWQLERDSFDPIELEWFWLYLILCLVCIFVGFAFGRNNTLRRFSGVSPVKNLQRYNQDKLIISAGGLIFFGILNRILIGGQDISEMGSSWTGVITMYALFTGAIPLGLCLSVLIFAKTGNEVSLVLAIIAAIPMLDTALVGVRREVLFALLITSGGAYYFAKNKMPPRAAVLATFIAGVLILNLAGEMRAFVNSGKGNLIDAFRSEEITKQFDYTQTDRGKASELGLAYYDFRYTSNTGDLEFGANYWNSIANQYVPAFILGRDFKESLMIPTFLRRASSVEEQIAFSNGSTRTGFSDSFRSFYWLGALIFGIIAYAFGRIYERAKFGGIAAQYFYLTLMASGLKAITHSTAEFFSSLPFLVAISILAFSFARFDENDPRNPNAMRLIL